jgi:mRNA interferase RelE/StbE
MNVKIAKRFEQNFNRIHSPDVLEEIVTAIESAQQAQTIDDIPGIKKMRNYTNAYRIRIESYRIGILYQGGSILEFVCVLHRNIVYKQFP